MRNVRLWRGLLGVDKRTVIEDIEFDEEGADGAQLVVARVRPGRGVSRRCGRCGRKAPWYDRGEGRRRWRGLDWGTVQVVLEADAPRVNCPAHGPTVVAVPWARHHAGHTLAFDDTVAWLAVACSKTAVCELMRIAWRTVGAIVARVWADTEKRVDRFANLRRIGIDEISYKRHHHYLTVVVDHDSGRLVWAAPGRDTTTLRRFFNALGAERCAQITHVSADAADWIADVVAERCPAAIRWPTRFMWWPGPPRHSMPSAAGPGTTRGRWPAARPNGVAGAPPRTPRRVPAMSGPASSRAPVMRCGRTPKTSPNAKPPSWPGSPRPTPACIAPICSKRACGMCFRSRARKASRPWTGGSPGRGAAASRYSSSWPAASCDTAKPSTPPSTTASPKD